MRPLNYLTVKKIKELEQKVEKILMEANPGELKDPDAILLDSKKVAELFRVKLSRVRSWRKSGRLRVVRIRKKNFYKVAELRRMLEENKRC